MRSLIPGSKTTILKKINPITVHVKEERNTRQMREDHEEWNDNFLWRNDDIVMIDEIPDIPEISDGCPDDREAGVEVAFSVINVF